MRVCQNGTSSFSLYIIGLSFFIKNDFSFSIFLLISVPPGGIMGCRWLMPPLYFDSLCLSSSHSFYGTFLCLRFEAHTSERTSFTSHGPVTHALGNIPAFRSGMSYTDTFHMLSHGTHIIILLFVIMETLLSERVCHIPWPLLLVEKVILHIGFHSVFFHKAVVLFRAITRIGNLFRREMSVTVHE